MAQDIGVVTPFYTRINLTMPGNVSYNWEYTKFHNEHFYYVFYKNASEKRKIRIHRIHRQVKVKK